LCRQRRKAFLHLQVVRSASAQQTQRVVGTIDKVQGNVLYVKSDARPFTLKLADNALIVGAVKLEPRRNEHRTTRVLGTASG
jgi:hypothetical protein